MHSLRQELLLLKLILTFLVVGNFFGGGYTNWPGEGKKLGSRVNQLLYGGICILGV